jgi:zona occludens toxin
MATSIHHGAPGSFKSFALVQRFGIDALKEGRVVVTNIRGFHNLELIKAQFPKIVFPDSAQIIHITSETAVGRRLMAGFFHWVPFRALILIDEGQRIYPDRRNFKLESLDPFVCPEGYIPETLPASDDYPAGIPRPEDIFTAFDMQRHFQWDIFISTPNIAKIQKPIREVAEYAYLHKSLSGKLPFLFKNTWYEFQHDPENNGKTASHRIGTPHKYKADPRIFKCYQSTATGEHSDSKADKSILSDNGVRLKLFIIFLSIGCSGYIFYTSIDSPKPPKLDAKASVPVPKAAPDRPAQVPNPDSQIHPVPAASDDSHHVPARQNDYFADILGYKILALAFHDIRDKEHKKLSFVVDSQSGLKVVHFHQLQEFGFRVHTASLCEVNLIHSSGRIIPVTCYSPVIDRCNAQIDTPNVFSHQHCVKYIEPNKDQQPAMMASVK